MFNWFVYLGYVNPSYKSYEEYCLLFNDPIKTTKKNLELPIFDIKNLYIYKRRKYE